MRDWMPWHVERRCVLRARMSDLADGIGAVLPASVALGWDDMDEVDPGPWLEELPSASPQRQQEFHAGRRAARRAMAKLDLPPLAIPMSKDRSPEWPAGLVGSISHCQGACVAILARATQVRGLGIDVEPAADLPKDVWDTVLRADELRDIHRRPPATWGRAALQYFVAKEAVYKAQFPVSKSLFDFHAIRLTITRSDFVAEFMISVAGFEAGSVLQGTLVQTQGFVAAAVVILR